MSASAGPESASTVGPWLAVVGALSALFAVILLVVAFPLSPIPGLAAVLIGFLGIRNGARRHRPLYQTVAAVGVFCVILGGVAIFTLLAVGEGSGGVTTTSVVTRLG
ncbi:hypothetical protein [Actinoalloteichus fjordicus]|uniref:DUF4190 domain-containing protein n=1 Tax=Actinoalloteichus fjordicus TaxID=1612552 RepID=A0AAC9PQT3_9PSEU|nr:hypothetical protein [Actinoalloteichus fjordicus]APU13400.1 hypothetical protein UA74_06635 [Actinoalloteichus fjordicus]